MLLTVYFDGSCPLCRDEMALIKARDIQQQLVLCDCSAADFDDTPFQVLGINRQLMLQALHVCDTRGVWTVGIPALALLYRLVDMPLFAALFGSRLTAPWARRIYPWFTRHRHWAVWLGLPRLYRLLAACQVRRAYRRTQRCSRNQCSL